MRTDNQHDRFPIAKRGYDINAVEAFLDVAAADNDRMLNEAAARIAALEADLEEAKRQEEAVHLTILAATKAKEDILEAARHQAGELAANGRMEGDRFVTDARMQAFQLVTEARKEAETIVGEARAEAAAIARVDGELAPDDPSERETELQNRIDEMQQVVAAMERELSSRPTAAEHEEALAATKAAEEAALAATKAAEEAALVAAKVADEPIPDTADEAPTDVAAELEDPPITVEASDAAPPAEVADDHADDVEIVVRDTPDDEPAHDETEIAVDDVAITVEAEEKSPEPAAAGPSDRAITDERTPEGVRRSFYSRRSARLPRIGVEGGRDTMAAMAGLRTNLTAAEATTDTGPEDSKAFEAV